VISEGDTEFMVMEYVQGKTLNDLIPKGGLRVPLLIKYALQMADALSTAHAAGIVHRDLKPANAMVTEAGLVKVLDFGLAKLTDRGPVPDTGDDRTRTIANVAPMTVEGSILGTVSYMSPEQAQGKKVDTRSDIFSFGAVLYEMATGVRAFEGESSLSTLSAILRDEAKPMSEVAPDVPPQLETVIQRCLRKLPDERWQSMKEVQGALSALKRESDSGSLYTTRVMAAAAPPSVAPASVAPTSVAPASVKAAAVAPAGQPAANSKAMMGMAAMLVVLLAGGGGAWWIMKKRAAEKHSAEVAAQTPPPAPAPEPAPVVEPPPPDTTLTNDSVLEMAKEKLSPDLILSQIRAAEKTNFDLSTPEVIRLTRGGITPLIIEQMRNPKRVPLAPPDRSNTPQNAKQNTKQNTTAPVAAANTPAIPPTATPAPVPIATNPAAALTPTPAPAPVAAVPQTVNVTVPDAMPFRITLAADIRADADMGQPVRFTASEDFKVNNVTVIARGAPVQGEISETPKKKLFGIGGSKLSFRLTRADTVGGHPINVRALAARKADGATQRPADTGQKTGSKDLAAAEGAQYIGYIDGEQSVTVPK